MITLAKLGQMYNSEVYDWLCKISSSMYNDMTADELRQTIHINVARRYAGELILLNETYKSQLQFIKEVNSSFE